MYGHHELVPAAIMEGEVYHGERNIWDTLLVCMHVYVLCVFYYVSVSVNVCILF